MSLPQLPSELINQIIENLPTAASVAPLSQVNHTLNTHLKTDGWRAFKSYRFPSYSAVPSTGPCVRLLTGLSRSWDRRAYYGLYLDPSTVTNLKDGSTIQWQKPTGQTMGFQPCIDSYEIRQGEGVGARLETLAHSAGSQLVFRYRDCRTTEKDQWFTYQPHEAREGADDVSALRLLKPSSEANPSGPSPSFRALYGTAAGKLSLLELSDRSTAGGAAQTALERTLQRRGERINALDLSPSAELAVVASGHNSLLLGSISQIDDHLPVLSPTQIHIEDGQQRSRIWKTKFLDETTVVIGAGPCKYPVQVLRVGPSGLLEEPIRKFRSMADSITGRIQAKSLSTYAIAALPNSSIASQAQGQVILAGYYDGVIRVHDLRSPREDVARYFDSVDDGSIYSLATLARERLVAGSSRHNMLKFFDLRVTGGRNYSYNQSEHGNDHNLFLHPKTETLPRRGGGQRGQARRGQRISESPVYSLSIPSSTSSTIYAGVENDVVQLNYAENPRNEILYLMEQSRQRYKAPAPTPPPRRRRGRGIEEELQVQDGPEFLELAMYDHRPELGMRLKVQQLPSGNHSTDLTDIGQDSEFDKIWIDSVHKVRDVAYPTRWR